MPTLLFVCTGNLCRSPIAEGLMRLSSAASRWHVDSAGTHARAGLAPAPLAIEAAAARGADIAALRSRPVTSGDFAEFDVMVALDRGHYDYLRAIAPCGSAVAIVMLADAGGQPLDVPDPYGSRRRAYTRAADLIALGLETLPRRLAELSARGK